MFVSKFIYVYWIPLRGWSFRQGTLHGISWDWDGLGILGEHLNPGAGLVCVHQPYYGWVTDINLYHLSYHPQWLDHSITTSGLVWKLAPPMVWVFWCLLGNGGMGLVLILWDHSLHSLLGVSVSYPDGNDHVSSLSPPKLIAGYCLCYYPMFGHTPSAMADHTPTGGIPVPCFVHWKTPMKFSLSHRCLLRFQPYFWRLNSCVESPGQTAHHLRKWWLAPYNGNL